MNSADRRCRDNVRCESMWVRMKEELIYGRNDTERITVEELATLSLAGTARKMSDKTKDFLDSLFDENI